MHSSVGEYTKALTLSQPNLNPLETSDFSALLFSRRSATYYCCQLYKDAEKDAAQVIRIRPEWTEVRTAIEMCGGGDVCGSLPIEYITNTIIF